MVERRKGSTARFSRAIRGSYEKRADLVRRQRDLEKSEKRLRSILEAQPELVLIIDEHGKYVDIFGRESVLLIDRPENLIGRNFEECLPASFCEKALETNRRAIESDETQVLEFELDVMAGERWFEARVSPMSSEPGEPKLAVWVVRNVTESKLAEFALSEKARNLSEAKDQALESDRLKSEFLAMLSHEIRTPLNGIMGFANLLLKTDLDESQKESARGIVSGSEILLNLINKILDHSKIEAARVELDRSFFNLCDCIQEVIESFKPRLAEGKLRIDYFINHDVPDTIFGDAALLRQVLFNVVGNAIKFTEEGRVHLEVSQEIGGYSENALDGLNRILHFTVSDTGKGISKDEFDKIFEPFAQADASSVRNYGGTGLGLSIAKKIAEMMGGNIWVESLENVGSIFHFTIVLTADKASSNLPLPGVGVSPEKPEKLIERSDPLNVLVAEDDAVSRRLAEALLSKMGHLVSVASNGREALNILEKDTYDILFMDIQMPEMDGIESAKCVRNGRAGERNRNIPIVAVTANATRNDRESCLEVGMNGYISKPLRPGDIETTLMDVLGSTKPS